MNDADFQRQLRQLCQRVTNLEQQVEQLQDAQLRRDGYERWLEWDDDCADDVLPEDGDD